eukprot:4748118-Lingulodinium_polyedra.AAC.1
MQQSRASSGGAQQGRRRGRGRRAPARELPHEDVAVALPLGETMADQYAPRQLREGPEKGL